MFSPANQNSVQLLTKPSPARMVYLPVTNPAFISGTIIKTLYSYQGFTMVRQAFGPRVLGDFLGID